MMCSPSLLNLKKKLSLFLAFFCFVSFCLCSLVVPASAQVSISSLADMDFGAVDFATVYSGSVRLATNGDVTVTGSGLVLSSGGNAGHLRVDTPLTGIIDIRCATSGTLVSPSATSLTISNVEIAVNSGQAYSDGEECFGSGLGDAVAESIDLDSLPTPNIYIGGEIVIPGAITLPPNRTYSTSGSGTPITLSIVVQ